AKFDSPPLSMMKDAILSAPSPFFKFVKMNGRFPRIRFHDFKVCAYQRSQIYFVYDEKIGAGDPRATLARYLFTFRDIDHIDRQVGQLGLKVAARLSPPDSIKHNSACGNFRFMSSMAARFMEASSRIAV